MSSSELIANNWKIKLGSVIAALLLFWYVSYSKNITRTINIRVVKPEVPKGMIINTRIPAFMPVTFSGEYDIIDFNVSDFRIQLENKNPESGENLYATRLVPDLPEEIEADYEDSMNVLLDRELTRSVPVIAEVFFENPEGIRPGYIYTSPLAVTVRGPASIVSEMTGLKTLSAKIPLKDSAMQKKLKLQPLPEFVEYTSLKKDEVTIFARGVSEKQISENEIRIDGLELHCLNFVKGLDMKVLAADDISIRLLQTDEGRMNKHRFRAGVFCPVVYDEISKSIKPSSVVENVGIVIEDLEGQSDILEVIPPSVTLQFERNDPIRAPRAERKGFKEHIIQ